MRPRSTAAFAAALAATLVFAAPAAASLVGIYRNSLASEAQRSQIVRLYGERCALGPFGSSLRTIVGKGTKECGYRTPVIGRNLEIAATERLLATGSKRLQRVAFVGLNLRGGEDGSGYQLAVYPSQGKIQLRKVLPGGRVRYLAIVREASAVKGVEAANVLRLRAFDTGPSSCRLLAFVNGKLVAAVTDESARELKGRASGFSVGALGVAKGASAGVANVLINVPSPF